jgi:cell division protein FtsB
MFESGGTIRKVAANRRVWRTFLFSMTLALGVLYIVQVNSASTKGFTLRDLERTNQELRQENDRLAAEIDRLRSLDSIAERETFLGLVKLENPIYIKASSESVALR